jgi:hypothetical protein
MADRSGYIGRAPGDSSVTIARQTNTLTSTQSTFVFNSGYDVGYLDVYINGTKLINATDYQATDGQNVTLTVAGASGDVIEFVAYKAFNLSTVIAEATDLNVIGSFTIDNSAVVESLTAGDNISLSGSNGDVTITGLAATDRIVAESLVVSGISTLQSSLVMGDSDQIQLGDSADLRIYHDGSNSYIKNNSGVLRIHGTEIQIRDEDSNENLAKFFPQGAVELYYDNSKKFETTSGGIQVTGQVSATTASFSGNVSVGGTLTYEDVTNIDSVGVVTARSGIVATGIVTATEFDGQTELRTWLFG